MAKYRRRTVVPSGLKSKEVAWVQQKLGTVSAGVNQPLTLRDAKVKFWGRYRDELVNEEFGNSQGRPTSRQAVGKSAAKSKGLDDFPLIAGVALEDV
jgi:hypothetical protein